MIELRNVKFSFGAENAVDNVSLSIDKGEKIALMGANGSGKSTLALLIKGLLIPREGSVMIDGVPADKCPPSKVGIVFQNPENQIAAAAIDREIAFGLENMGVEFNEMRRRVDQALREFGLEKYRKNSPYLLSGGQLQKLALAGTMVMNPEYLVLDEPTSMLDPASRKGLLKMIFELQENIGVLFVTQFGREAALFDRLIVMQNGKNVFNGSPDDFFKKTDLIRQAGVDIPVKYMIGNVS